MATGGDANKRHFYGPRALGALLPGITRPAFRRRAPAGAQLMADWPQIVGPELAHRTEPLRLSGGTLTLACHGAMAIELQHLAPQLIGRINGMLGTQLVERVRFVQTAPPARAVDKRGPRIPAIEAARTATAGLPPGPLRDALERLGQHVLQPEPLDPAAPLRPPAPADGR